MTKPPPGWATTTIGEITLPVRKAQPKDRPDEVFTYIDIGGIDPDKARIAETKELLGRDAPSRARQVVRGGDTVLSTVRVNLRKTAMVPAHLDGQIASTGFSVLRPAPGVLPRFLLHQVTNPAFVVNLAAKQTGSSYPAVRDRDVRAMPFLLPPVAEQERIVAAIEEHFSHLDAAEASLRGALERLPMVGNQVLDRVVHGAMLGAVEFRRPEPGDSLPEGWCWRGLDDLGELARGKSKHRPRNDPALYGGEYPFIQTGDVANAGRTLTEFSQTYTEEGLAQSRLWPAGTLAITIAANIADTTILGFSACFPDSVVGFVADGSLVQAAWVEAFMRTAKGDLERYAPATAQKNINLRTLRQVRVPVPPLDSQRQLLAKLTDAEECLMRVSDDIENAVLRAEHLRRGVLTAAFAGQLVPQDPADEPASKVLNRIRAEAPAKKPTRKKTSA